MESVSAPSIWFWSDFFENWLKLEDFRVLLFGLQMLYFLFMIFGIPRIPWGSPYGVLRYGSPWDPVAVPRDPRGGLGDLVRLVDPKWLHGTPWGTIRDPKLALWDRKT